MVFKPNTDNQRSTLNSGGYMKKMCLFFTVIGIFITANVFASAVIVDVKGKASIKLPDGKSLSPDIGIDLPDGTKIRTDDTSSLSLMLMNGTIDDISGKQSYTVGATANDGQKKTVLQGIALAMNEISSTGSGATVHGMVKMTNLGPEGPKPTFAPIPGSLGPQGTYPVNIALEPVDRITFRWEVGSKIDFTNPYVIIENDKKKIIATSPITPISTEVSIKNSLMKLQPGQRYAWRFASNEKGKYLGKSRKFNFSILSIPKKKTFNEDLAKLKTMKISDDGKLFLSAQLYFSYKMYDKMVECLLQLWDKNKTDVIKKELFMAYQRMGQTKEAMKYQ